LALLVNHSQKWAFIHIPKTGGTTINHILKNVDGTEFLTAHDSLRILPNDNYFIFTFIRNPFTRMASVWQAGVRKNKYPNDFGKFLNSYNENDTWLLPQWYYIQEGATDKREISFIGRYENFTSDIKKIFTKLNINYKIPHLNKNPIYDKHPNIKQHKYYNVFYTDNWMIELVKERYQNDFKIFNYELDLPR